MLAARSIWWEAPEKTLAEATLDSRRLLTYVLARGQAEGIALAESVYGRAAFARALTEQPLAGVLRTGQWAAAWREYVGTEPVPPVPQRGFFGPEERAQGWRELMGEAAAGIPMGEIPFE
jgi:hypothetical protein